MDNAINENELIEKFIIDKYKLTIPALRITLIKETNKGNKIDIDDLKEVFAVFGKINRIEAVSEKSAICVFDTFIDAKASMTTLSVSKDIEVKWYDSATDENDVIALMKNKLMKPTNGEIIENINSTMLNKPIQTRTTQIIDDDAYYPSPYIKNKSNENFFTNSYEQYLFISDFDLSPQPLKYFRTLMQSNQKKIDYSFYHFQSDKDIAERTIPNGKFSCKFFIQIENDAEFQVCKRIIGAEGINIKRIVDFTSKGVNGNYIQDSVKIRLRGKGSGYKEGPYNRESEEMLNLCVSSKYVDKYRKACSLVQELLINVYEEYKRYCERRGRTPTTNLTIQKVETISTKK